MPRGRKPDSERALTNAERQARYRLRRQAEQVQKTRPVRSRPPPDRRSRAQRWNTAVADLIELQAEYAGWLDAIPKSL